MSVLIRGGRIITAADDYVGDVFVEDGKIALLGSALDVAAAKALQENIALAAARHILRAGGTGATPATAPTTAAAGDPRAN